MKCDLRPLSLHVGDESLQEGGCLHLVSDPLDLCLVLEELVECGAVLDDEGRDGEERKEQHVDHVQPLPGLGDGIDLEQASHSSLLHL